MTSSTGWRGLIRAGIAAELLHGVAHGGEIDDAGDSGEILQEDAAGGEGDFFVGLGILVVPFVPQAAMERMSSFLTLRPSSVRRRFSSRMRRE